MAQYRRDEFVPGQSKEQDLWWWCAERERIRVAKEAGKPKPWTEDPVMLRWKFTNVFREADTGTRALREAEEAYADEPALLLFNAFWYRMFNRREHAAILPVRRFRDLRRHIEGVIARGEPALTNAHLTWPGFPGVGAAESMLRVSERVWDVRRTLASRIERSRSIEYAARALREFDGVGPFIAYEVATDLRWSILSDDPVDRMTWCNINRGGGSARGLMRLGLEPTVEAAIDLLRRRPSGRSWLPNRAPWPFEAREIEHSLCEFDKWERTRSGLSRPRHRYDGEGER